MYGKRVWLMLLLPVGATVLMGTSAACSNRMTRTLSSRLRLHGVPCVDKHSSNSCQVALSPLYNRMHNKHIFSPPNGCISLIHGGVLDNIRPQGNLQPLLGHLHEGGSRSFAILTFLFIYFSNRWHFLHRDLIFGDILRVSARGGGII